MKILRDMFLDESDIIDFKTDNPWNNIDIPIIREYLPYQYFDDKEKIFVNKNSVGFCLEMVPQVGVDLILEQKLDALFSRLPDKTSVQVLLHASPKVGNILNNYAQSNSSNNKVLNDLFKGRAKYLAEKIHDSEFSTAIRNFRVIISFSFNLDDIEECNINVNRTKHNVQTTLESFPFNFRFLEPKDLINFIRDIFDTKQSIYSSDADYNPLQPISDQIFSQEDSFVITKDHVKDLENQLSFKSFSVKKYPKEWTLGMSNFFIGDYFESNLSVKSPFILHYAFHVIKSTVAGSVVNKSLVVNAARSMGNYFPKYIERAKELTYVNDYVNEGGRYVYTNFQICLLGKETTVEDAEQIMIKMFAAKKFTLVEDKFISLVALINLLPMSWGEGYQKALKFFGTTKKTIAKEAAKFIPIQGEWKGTKTQAMSFLGRRGQLFYIWPFDNKGNGNFNINITGKSGSGKSVLMQELISTVLAKNGKVFVLDIGRSYNKLCKLLKGTFIEFNSKSKIVYNPFSNLYFRDDEEKADVMTMIKSIVQVMVAPLGGINNYENAALSQCLNEVWQSKGNKAIIDDLAEWFSNNSDQRIRDLGYRLYSFTSQGFHGKYFNEQSNINFDDNFFVFELDEIKDNAELLPVILQILMSQINSALLMGDRTTPTLIVIDEAWKALQSDQSAPFIESLARTTRKYNGSLVTGTQQLADFFTSASANAAYSNSDWKLFMAQDISSYEEARREGRIKISEDMEKVISSLHTKDKAYSEVMICSPFGRAVGRLVLDPYSELLYSTNADEYSDLMLRMNSGLTVDQAIKSKMREVYV